MIDRTLYDIGIVGGGLAGLSLAIQCAEKGHRVILFEKEVYPFHRVCGEYISMESWQFLQRIGVGLEEKKYPRLNRLKVTDIKGNNYDITLPLGGFGISRFLLDDLLYRV